MAVVPYVHDLVNLLKKWDSPIGHAVKWFDDVITSLQEVIGGPQRKDIYGNELKGRITDALKSLVLVLTQFLGVLLALAQSGLAQKHCRPGEHYCGRGLLPDGNY